MALIVFNTIYGKHTAQPLETVDVTVIDTDILEEMENSVSKPLSINADDTSTDPVNADDTSTDPVNADPEENE